MEKKLWLCLFLKIVKLISVLPLYQKIFQCAQTVRGCICVLVNSKMSKMVINKRYWS